MPCTALAPTNGSDADCVKSRVFGLKDIFALSEATNSAIDPDPPRKAPALPYTSSPTPNSVTPSPKSEITPEKSPPTVEGKDRGIIALSLIHISEPTRLG